MEPKLSDGDRLLIGTSRREPAAGGLFAVWDGSGLAVKRIKVDGRDGRGEPLLRLKSANPEYADYAIPAAEARIVGKVLWTIRRT